MSSRLPSSTLGSRITASMCSKGVSPGEMPRGGKRPGSGRKVGSLTKRTQQIAEAATAAKAAAPYVHPRLSATELKGEDNSQIVVEIIKRTYNTDGALDASPRALPLPRSQ
jgi:hypothetical protein